MSRDSGLARISAGALTTNTANTLIGLVIGKAAMIVMLAVLSRALGVRGLGQYGLAVAMSEIFRVGINAGFDQALMRRLADHTLFASVAIRPVIATKLLLSVLALIAAVGSGYLFGFDTVVVVGIALAGAEVFTYGASQTLASVFYADMRSSKTIGPIFFTSVAYLLAGLTGAAFHQGVWYFLGCLILNSSLLSLALAYSLRRELRPTGTQASGVVRTFMREAMPLGILSLVVFSYTRIDTIILGHLGGPEQVGYYAAAYRLTEGSLAIALAVSRTALPAFAVISASGREIFSLYRAGLRYLAPVAVAVSAAYALTAPFVVSLLYGSAFSPSATTVVILSIGVGFVFINQLSTSLLIGMGRYNLLLLISVAVLAVNLVATIVLVLAWGFQGAAIATAITESVNLVLQMLAICVLAGSVAPVKPLVGGILALAVAPCAWIATQAHITLSSAAIAIALAVLILIATGNLRLRDFRSLLEQYRRQPKVAQ